MPRLSSTLPVAPSGGDDRPSMTMKRAALLSLALTAACAGAPAPQHAPATAARPIASESVPGAAQPAEVRSVAAPDGLSAVLRVGDVQRTWGNVLQLLAGTPVGFLLLGAGQMGPELLLEEALGPALADVVDLARPVDVAMLGTSDPRMVVSLSVSEREMPRLQERFVLKEQRGLLRVEGLRGGKPDQQKPGLSCAFDPGERRDSARLVCAQDPKDIEAAAAYLVRVVGPEPIEADARMEIPAKPILESMKDDPSLAAADDDSHAARVGRELGESFLRDLESISIDLTWSGAGAGSAGGAAGAGGTEVEAALGLRFAGRRSPLSLALAPATAPDPAVPPAFFRLPRDASLAFYTQGASRAELAPLREHFFRSLREDMLAEGYEAALLDAFLERLGTLVLTGGPIVFGAGVDRAAADKALLAYQGAKGAPRARQAARRALEGWMLFAVEEPAALWISGVKELIRLGDESDRHRASAAAGKGGPGAAGAGGAGDAKKDDEDKVDTDAVIVRAPAALPAGTLHVELRRKPLTKDAPPARTDHMYVVPGGSRTWIGFGEDDAAVVERLRIAVEPGRDDRTLTAAPGLEALRQRGTLAAGFSSLEGWTLLGASGDTPEELDEAASSLSKITGLPARGETPIPLAVTSEVLGSGGARMTARLRLPAPVIQDVLVLLTR